MLSERMAKDETMPAAENRMWSSIGGRMGLAGVPQNHSANAGGSRDPDDDGWSIHRQSNNHNAKAVTI